MMADMASLLGAYDIVRKTKEFPVPFWAVLQDDEGHVLIETMDGVRWVDAGDLERAIALENVRLEIEL